MGHDAWSCDILPTELHGPHFKGDVLEHLNKSWDMMIAFPPCTYLCNSGVRWLHEQPCRWAKMFEACAFFKILQDAPIDKIAIENPVPHKYARHAIGSYTQKIQPWQHGHEETKGTCLWLKNLPEITPTHIVGKRKPRVHFEAPSPDRWKNRSRTLYGIAAAMAEQWGR